MSTTLISGGLVISATDEITADVLVDGERVVALLAPESGLADSADRVID
ncbi:MAG: hypothetical protein QOC74_1517, partial [Pseudonocardiales bacterium]|nr:hypothetical protein [Pseudonocardiales bacterium]